MLFWLLSLGCLVGSSLAISCPQHCACFTDPDGYVSANCSVLALGQVAPSDVEMANFMPQLGGYSTHLTPRAFLAFTKLKFLWMINCSVIGLPDEVFHGLSYVIRLDLSYNKIRHLNGAVFKRLGSLTTLKLRSNPLELTPWDVVVSDSLQELDLGQCGLRTIPFGTFVGVPRLSRLYLDGNELRTISYHTVPTTLRYVNLARNRIANVPTEVFTSMNYLRKIDLSKNPINCTCNLLITQDWFSGQGVIFDNGVTCVEPGRYKGVRLSKINENELCTLEDVKRQRRINDIQSYRDSKTHRVHNMIVDPDLQSDQPNLENYAEVLFHDDGLTHMEISHKPYSIMPTDLSDETNKLATGKHELHSTEVEFPHPTRLTSTEMETEDSSKEEIMHVNTAESLKDIDLLDASSSESENVEVNSTHIPSNSSQETTHSVKLVSMENATISSTETTLLGGIHSSKSPHEEFLDEGYSPVYNLTDVMLSDGEGSGDDGEPLANYSPEEKPTTEEAFTFRSSVSDTSDYNYDNQHDYSGEVGTTTEAMSPLIEEGSGEPENETLSSSGTYPLWSEGDEENATTPESFQIVNETTSEDYNVSSSYSSSSEMPLTVLPTVEETSTETATATEESSTEASVSSSLAPTDPFFESTSHEYVSSEVPVTVSSSESSTEHVSSTTETPSSSEGNYFPVISPMDFDVPEEEETTTVATTRETSPTPEVAVSSTSSPPVEVEVFKKVSTSETKAEINVGPSREERPAGSLLTYVIAGLLVALIVAVVLVLVCRRLGRSKKKVRLPDTEAPGGVGTELQDMLLPRPAENGVKVLPTSNGKDHAREEEKEALRPTKEWEDGKKDEPIETVTARLSVLAGPQTPVFIHKTLA